MTRHPVHWVGFRLLTLFVLVLPLLLLAGCKEENKFVAPPPPQVGVAQPLQQPVTLYLEQTGNTEAFNEIDLVARVQGFLSDQTTRTARPPRAGTAVRHRAGAVPGQASAGPGGADHRRRLSLCSRRQNSTGSRPCYARTLPPPPRSTRPGPSATCDQGERANQQAAVTIAAINLGYTRVTAPFDGVVTRHLVSVGELVGQASTPSSRPSCS